MKKIPDIINVDIDEAKKILKKENIEINDIIEKCSLTTKRNHIIKVDPSDKLKDDEKIDIYVSKIRLIPFLFLFMLLALFGLGGTAYYLSTAPKIGESETPSHGDNKVIEVTDDSHLISGEVSYYLYCVNDENNLDTCEWERTDTKNVEISKSGKWYVWFKAVSENGEVSAPSKVKEVNVDNEPPMVKSLTTSSTTNTITASITLDDDYKEQVKIYYALDDSEYVESNNNYVFENLKPNTEYLVKVKIVDENGNEYILTKIVKTQAENNSNNSNGGNNSNNPNDPNNPNGGNNSNNPNDPNNPNGGNNSNNPNDSNNPNGGNNSNNQDEEELLAPKIDMSDIPTVIYEFDDYVVPTNYWFDEKGGNISCELEDGSKITNTNTMSLGDHIITCKAVGNNGLSATVSKYVRVDVENGEDEEFNGYVRMTLYYPINSTNREYIVKSEDTVNYGNNLWKPYTGPILVRLDDISNVYIKYKINGKVYIVSPSGNIVVDIDVDKYMLEKNEKTKVNIYYGEDVTLKQYRLNKGEWQDYTGEFEVSGNTLIEARGTKNEKVYDSEGNFAYEQPISATDNAYVALNLHGGYTVIPNSSGGTTIIGTNGSYSGSGGILNIPTGDYPPGEYVIDGDKLVPGDPYGSGGVIIPYNHELLSGPNIISSHPVGKTTKTRISITTAEEARDIYYSINDGSYKKYTEPFDLNYNAIIKAYYIRKSDGKKSLVSDYRVNNISDGPIINVDYKPYFLSERTDKTVATISAEYYTGNIEYSFDGEIYSKYTKALTIKESCTLYVRAHDANNKYTYYKEKIILNSPGRKAQNLDVSIATNPDKGSNKVRSVEVTINYDENATKRYYKLSKDAEWQEYTDSLTLTENATVYAYATNEQGDKGYATKQIDYLYEGVSEPTFNVVPSSASSVYRVEINYDENATVKRYSLDGENYYDYTEPFYVYDSLTVYATNSDELGNTASSKYEINVVALPRIQVLDNGKYIFIRLNYPESADVKEYKWKETGEWKTYPESGIILVHPEYKDKFDESAEYYDAVDQTGKQVRVTKDHVYLLDVLSSDIFYNLFMRWDSFMPEKPSFVKSTDEPTKNLKLWINYDDTAVKKLFKIQYSDGTQTQWMQYTKPIDIDDNNTIIYAKSVNDKEIWSDTASILINNIDKVQPEVNAIGDFTTPKNKVTFTIQAKDNMKIDSVAYLKGSYDSEHMKNYGIYTNVNKQIIIDENGTYTIFAIDKAGNMTSKQIEINNVDKNAPEIFITTSDYNPEDKDLVSSMKVTIDHKDTVSIKYSFDNNTWIDYNEPFVINSFDVAKYKNSDKTLTIYAKGVDEASNETNVSEVIYNLDLDIPNKPVINVSDSYPVIDEYGIKLEQKATITFDDKEGTTHYYCVKECDTEDNWKLFKGEVKLLSTNGTIHAKSVRDISGITVEESQEYDLPADALEEFLRDNNRDTSITLNKAEYLAIDPLMIGKKINIIVSDTSGIKYNFTNDQKNKLGSDIDLTSTTNVVTIPSGAKYLYLYANNKVVNEVEVNTQPSFDSTSVYPTINSDNIEKGYTNVTINYNSTAVVKQYSYDNENWLNYDETPVKINVGDSLYARQIDKYEKVGEVAVYESKIDDMLSNEAYDENNTTYDNVGTQNHLLYLGSSVRNKLLNVTEESTSDITLKFYDQFDQLISTDTRQGVLREVSYIIPSSASYVTFSGTNLKVYEVRIAELTELVANPRIIVSDENEYKLTKTVTIYYPGNQYTNEYSIDDGTTWIEYTEPFEIDHYTTIHARSKDSSVIVSRSTYKVNKLPSTLTYVTNVDGLTLDSKKVLYGSVYGELASPQRDNYTFAGWYLDEELTQEVTSNSIVNNKLNHNVYAKWNINTYNVNFEYSNATLSSNSVVIEHGGTQTVTLTPNSDYALDSVSCTNGYTIDAESGATTPQTITIHNNNNVGDSTCTITFKKASCVVTQSKYVQGYRNWFADHYAYVMDGTFTATYQCNGVTGNITSCSYSGTVESTGVKNVNTTCNVSNACTIKNNHYITERKMYVVDYGTFKKNCNTSSYDTQAYISPELPTTIECSCD